MTLKIFRFVVVLLLAATPLAKADERMTSVHAVDLFSRACVTYYNDRAAFADLLKSLRAEPNDSYEKNSPSDIAYEVSISESDLTIVDHHGACSVFAKDADPDMAKKMLEGFLEFLGTQGATHTSQKLPIPEGATGESIKYTIVPAYSAGAFWIVASYSGKQIAMTVGAG